MMSSKEIDLLDIAARIWRRRVFLLKIISIGLSIGLIIAFSIPRSYTVRMTLSPESGRSNNKNGLIGMASMLGISNINNSEDVDALNISLFPDIVSSTPFLLELFDVKVQTKKDGVVTYPLYDYIDTQNAPWWKYVAETPSSILSALAKFFGKKDKSNEKKINPFALTKKQFEKLDMIRQSIHANVDKKTGITTVDVTLQDPVAAAILADTVIKKLQEYITTYRVSKAKEDYSYLKKLYYERQVDYYRAQSAYADYMDANKSVILQKVLSEKERLQNETNLSYQVYSQVATQLQMARAKIQEAKPVFAVVEPASVPLKASGVSKIVIIFSFLFLSFIAGVAWIIFELRLKNAFHQIVDLPK